MMSTAPPRRGIAARFAKGLRETREVLRSAYTGPCGHQVNGDARSWSCPTCGASGSTV